MLKLGYCVIFQKNNFCKRSTFLKKHQIKFERISFNGNSVKICDCRAFSSAAGHIATKNAAAAGTRGIGETRNAVQLNGVFGKIITCVFICFFICQSTFLSYYFSALNIFSRF